MISTELEDYFPIKISAMGCTADSVVFDFSRTARSYDFD
jgi:hypothetical protein